jgi:hypothetical protein
LKINSPVFTCMNASSMNPDTGMLTLASRGASPAFNVDDLEITVYEVSVGQGFAFCVSVLKDSGHESRVTSFTVSLECGVSGYEF